MAGNWNRCIELARAPFVTFCHDDDTLLPHALDELMEIQKVAGKKAVFSTTNSIDADGKMIAEYIHPRYKFGILITKKYFEISLFNCMVSNIGFHGAALFPKQNMVEIGGYSEDFNAVADTAFGALYTYKFGAIQYDVPLLNYRMAVNSSFSVSAQLAHDCKKVHDSIKNKLHLPNIILNRIVRAVFNYTQIFTYVRLGFADHAALKNVPLVDRLIVKACWCSLIPTKYKFKTLLKNK
jgi:hypothetical protein